MEWYYWLLIIYLVLVIFMMGLIAFVYKRRIASHIQDNWFAVFVQPIGFIIFLIVFIKEWIEDRKQH